jgi:para-aminobenzoate synthetase component I
MPVTLRTPIIEEIKTPLSTAQLFDFFRHSFHAFFLDSGMDPQKLGRFSFMGAEPFLVLSSRGGQITVNEGGVFFQRQGNPFDVLGEYLDKYKLDHLESAVPFSGGAVGYLGYDLNRFIEKLTVKACDDLDLPESYICFYDIILVFDHLLNKVFLISTGFPELDESARQQRAHSRIKEIRSRLARTNHAVAEPPFSVGSSEELKCNFTHDDYVRAVERARQYIIDGDIFEVNLSQRFETPFSGDAWPLYMRLRVINPAPFACYLGFGDITIAGASPERFLKVQGDMVETRPIKGTRRRGNNLREDRQQKRALLSSEKDHAENMMIVDLERNDLGKVCRYGTVKVTELAILETYPTVFHLTSTITGRLADGKNRIDLLKAAFPGGSITGAPKIRAMEIIDELEPTRRSVYTGSVGYFGYDGSMDLNIVIRAFLIHKNRLCFQVGGAVVYDSNPEAEYRETLDKGFALMKALNLEVRG